MRLRVGVPKMATTAVQFRWSSEGGKRARNPQCSASEGVPRRSAVERWGADGRHAGVRSAVLDLARLGLLWNPRQGVDSGAIARDLRCPVRADQVDLPRHYRPGRSRFGGGRWDDAAEIWWKLRPDLSLVVQIPRRQDRGDPRISRHPRSVEGVWHPRTEGHCRGLDGGPFRHRLISWTNLASTRWAR